MRNLNLCGSGSWNINKPSGGLFMASSIANSCRIWNTNNLHDITYIQPYILSENELIWLTDTCPHESLPLKQTVFRQWFRVVTSNISIWDKKYDTENRLGIKPSSSIIIK
jgi:hypothetical protein